MGGFDVVAICGAVGLTVRLRLGFVGFTGALTLGLVGFAGFFIGVFVGFTGFSPSTLLGEGRTLVVAIVATAVTIMKGL